ncbi:hypothetical protein [Paenibacillus kobensis]|uniref:hypothetical protein n=1 Tax=Paenibacillus kobensis TaxID=59841 RepID=UPI000FDAEC68|nr:hypothetical protein [Paenibacillus kobensis]
MRNRKGCPIVLMDEQPGNPIGASSSAHGAAVCADHETFDITNHAANRLAPEHLPGIPAKAMSCQFRGIDDPLQEGRQIFIRRTCCLNYRLSEEDKYGYTCPLISDERRLDKFMKSHATG